MNKLNVAKLMAGSYSLESTLAIFENYFERGADVFELSIPFSDPIAQGNIHPLANLQALERFKGSGVATIFEIIKEVRAQYPIPIIISTYTNPVFKYGFEEFCKKCDELGVEGLHLFDCPFEESKPYLDIIQNYQVDLILSISKSKQERVEEIAKHAKRYVYVIESEENEIQKITETVKAFTNAQIIFK